MCFHSLVKAPPWRAADIGRYLSVTKQRAHQIVRERGFPEPLGEDAIGRFWDPSEVRQWAREWARGRPWRRLAPHEVVRVSDAPQRTRLL